MTKKIENKKACGDRLIFGKPIQGHSHPVEGEFCQEQSQQPQQPQQLEAQYHLQQPDQSLRQLEQPQQQERQQPQL
eukprot:Awhi_evm1s6931